MAEEEEVLLEVEAVKAVYGDDCRVILDFPPHLHVLIRPRTADDASQQFVEVVLGIKSCAQYPSEPPHVYVVDMKGLDENRQAHLIASIQNKAQELSSCLMLVALCEESVEILSNMNHPEGDCPLCLYPLVTEDKDDSLPFMKLMSCYHCFHNKCIIKWWKWLQEQNDNKIAQETTAAAIKNQGDMLATVNQLKGNCPVCRKVFDVKDIEHALDSLETNLSQPRFAGMDTDEDEKVFLQSELENKRRQKFEALLELQQENSGLIEPKKNLQILPGMFLPEPSVEGRGSIFDSESSMNNNKADQSAFDSSSSMNKAATSKQKKASMWRKNSFHNSRKQKKAQPMQKQWIKKEAHTSEQ